MTSPCTAGFAVSLFPLLDACAGSCAPKPQLHLLGKALALPIGVTSPAALCFPTTHRSVLGSLLQRSPTAKHQRRLSPVSVRHNPGGSPGAVGWCGAEGAEGRVRSRSSFSCLMEPHLGRYSWENSLKTMRAFAGRAMQSPSISSVLLCPSVPKSHCSGTNLQQAQMDAVWKQRGLFSA